MCGLGIFSLYYYYYYSLICFAHCVPMVTTIYLIAAKMMVQFVRSRLHPQISNGQLCAHVLQLCFCGRTQMYYLMLVPNIVVVLCFYF